MKLCHLLWTSTSKKGASVSKEFALSIEVQIDISDLPFVQNNDYQCKASHRAISG